MSSHNKLVPNQANIAELMTVYRGIALAQELHVTDLLVQTDCQYAVFLFKNAMTKSKKQINSIKKKKGITSNKILHCQALLMDLIQKPMILNIKHVKGHAPKVDSQHKDSRRFYVQDWCDTEAKKVMRANRRRLKYKLDNSKELLEIVEFKDE